MASLHRLASAGSRAVLLKPSAATLRGLSQPPTAPTALVVRSMASKASKADKTPLVLTETVNGVTTITMNRPDKLNGWVVGWVGGWVDGSGPCTCRLKRYRYNCRAEAFVTRGPFPSTTAKLPPPRPPPPPPPLR